MGTLKTRAAKNRGYKFKSSTLSSFVIVILLSLSPNQGSAHLNLGKQCGLDLTCLEHEYCREFDHSCQSCSFICKEGSNNFSKDTCEAGCQDYIHDDRYIRLQNNNSGDDLGTLYKNLLRDVFVLKVLVGVCLVVITLILGAFIAFVTYFWRTLHPTKKSSKAGTAHGADKIKSNVDKKGNNNKKEIDLPVIYDNRYGVRSSPEPRRRDLSSQNIDNDVENSPHRQSPSKVSETETMNSLNSSKTNGAVTTNSRSGTGTSTPNGINNNRFRKQPSESTLPEYMAYDSASLAQAQGVISQGSIYTHHV